MKRLILLAMMLGGCASYDSTYWRHPVTGVTVECDWPWYETTGFGLSAPFKDRCERLMDQAGLVRIPHDEGKAWEATR